jgi:hypothetical protein
MTVAEQTNAEIEEWMVASHFGLWDPPRSNVKTAQTMPVHTRSIGIAKMSDTLKLLFANHA